jgi:transcriptional regulator with XRE-family HTH domain
MPTSQATLILHEVEHSKPISAKVRAFQHRRLQNRFQRFILKTFREQQKKKGLTQKELAQRIDSRPEQVNRWLSIPANLTLNTICDLLLGMAVDLDEPSATCLEDLAASAVDRVDAPVEIQEAVNSIQIEQPPLPYLLSIGLRTQVESQANTIIQPSTAVRRFARLDNPSQGTFLDIGAHFLNDRRLSI